MKNNILRIIAFFILFSMRLSVIAAEYSMKLGVVKSGIDMHPIENVQVFSSSLPNYQVLSNVEGKFLLYYENGIMDYSILSKIECFPRVVSIKDLDTVYLNPIDYHSRNIIVEIICTDLSNRVKKYIVDNAIVRFENSKLIFEVAEPTDYITIAAIADNSKIIVKNVKITPYGNNFYRGNIFINNNDIEPISLEFVDSSAEKMIEKYRLLLDRTENDIFSRYENYSALLLALPDTIKSLIISEFTKLNDKNGSTNTSNGSNQHTDVSNQKSIEIRKDQYNLIPLAKQKPSLYISSDYYNYKNNTTSDIDNGQVFNFTIIYSSLKRVELFAEIRGLTTAYLIDYKIGMNWSTGFLNNIFGIDTDTSNINFILNSNIYYTLTSPHNTIYTYGQANLYSSSTLYLLLSNVFPFDLISTLSLSYRSKDLSNSGYIKNNNSNLLFDFSSIFDLRWLFRGKYASNIMLGYNIGFYISAIFGTNDVFFTASYKTSAKSGARQVPSISCRFFKLGVILDLLSL